MFFWVSKRFLLLHGHGPINTRGATGHIKMRKRRARRKVKGKSRKKRRRKRRKKKEEERKIEKEMRQKQECSWVGHAIFDILVSS